MKLMNLTVLMCLGVAAFAQDVQFDYNRSANFNAYKTYQWIDYKPVQLGDQLLDQDIKRAVDEQLAGKGLRRVESGGDLLVGYQAGISQEKEFDSFGRWLGWSVRWWGNWGNTRVTTSTIDVGKLVIGLFDPAAKTTRVARLRVQDTQHQQGSRQELSQPREGYGQAVQELSPSHGKSQCRAQGIVGHRNRGLRDQTPWICGPPAGPFVYPSIFKSPESSGSAIVVLTSLSPAISWTLGNHSLAVVVSGISASESFRTAGRASARATGNRGTCPAGDEAGGMLCQQNP